MSKNEITITMLSINILFFFIGMGLLMSEDSLTSYTIGYIIGLIMTRWYCVVKKQ